MCLHLAASVKWLNQFVPRCEFIHIFSTENPWAKSLEGFLHGACLGVLNEMLQVPLCTAKTMESNSSFTFSTPPVLCGVFNRSAALDF